MTTVIESTSAPPAHRVASVAAVGGGLMALVGSGILVASAGEAVRAPARETWVLAAALLLAELYVLAAPVHGPVALSPYAAVLAFGALMLAPGELIMAQLVAIAAATVLPRRRDRRDAALRAAGVSLGAVAGAGLLIAVGPLPEHELQWLVVLGAVLVVEAIPVLLRSTVRLGAGVREWLLFAGPAVAKTSLGGVAGWSIAVAAVELVHGERAAAILLVVPLLSLGAALRTHAHERRRLDHLGFLYEALRSVHRAPGIEDGLHDLLQAVRRLLDVEIAWVVIFPRRPGDRPLVTSVDASGAAPLRARALSDGERAAVDRALGSPGALVVDRGRATPSETALLGAVGARRALAVALRDGGISLGVLVAGQRAPGRRFAAEDVVLFESFAEHAGVLLENDRLEGSLQETRALKEQLRYQAYHDSLTGLPNRVLFAEHVARTVAGLQAGTAAVLFLDLDDFKLINDSLGHHAGDELLVAAAGRIRAAVRPEDVPARLGGDEFAVLAIVAEPAEAEQIAERLVRGLEAPFVVDGREVSVHASVGIAYGKPSETSAEDLLRNADVAMYHAKQGDKRRFVVYEQQMHVRVRRRQELASALERAVTRGEIGLHYQPIVDLGSRRLIALEALARWTRPHHGLVAPATFIPLADEIGLMVEIGRLVLREACDAGRSWQRAFAGHERLRVNVNLAPSELHDEHLVAEVSRVLEHTGLEPELLVLEITESGVMRHPEQARRTMTELRELGVSLALDDFGTGHSSLAHLRGFPLDSLKIAREFVAGLPSGHVDRAFVETIVRLGASLGLDVVAEGIESEEQALAVAELGCVCGQGFLFGEPLGTLGVSGYLGAAQLPAFATPFAAAV